MKRILLCLLLFTFQFTTAQVYTDTQGKLEVSASGSAVYTLPIAMPPSAHNTGPAINIVYTSGSFGGIAGQGWNIQSISAISRIATRKDIDGYRDGVDFDDNDKLALDGQRLILKSGNYFAPGSVYQTETHSNTRIELLDSEGALYFVVTAPDGSRSWYGNYDGASATDSISWYIVRFEDTNGNYITYNYVQPFGKSLCISEIHFSGSVYANNPSLTNTISFHYKAAGRTEFAYIGGVKHEKEALLERVEVHSDGLLFRKYELTHSADGVLGYERLTQLQEFNPENEGANPIIFEYNETETTIEGSEYLTTYDNNLEFQQIAHSGDFDGDGRLDFISDNQLYTRLFMGNTGTPPVNLPFSAGKRHTFPATTIANGRLQTAQSIVNAQENWDNISFNIYNFDGEAVSLSHQKTITFDNTGNRTSTGNCPLPPGGPTYLKDNNRYLEGDFNGDGISEVLIIATIDEYEQNTSISEDGPALFCHIDTFDSGYGVWLVDLSPDSPTDLGSFGYMQLETPETFGISAFSFTYTGDFDGDGKTDILAIHHDQTYKVFSIRELTVPPYREVEVLGEGSLAHYATDKQLLFGDFNGDGKTDLITPEAEHSDQWYIYYANPNPAGGSFFVEESHNIVEYWPNSEDFYDTQTHFRNYYALDTNGDGKTDLVQVWLKYYEPPWAINDHDTQWRVTTFVNNIGNSVALGGFTEDYDSPTIHDSDSPDLPIPVAATYKHQGANKELLMVRNHYDQLTYIDFTKDVRQDNRLAKITSSGGDIVEQISYQSMEPENGDLGSPEDFYSSTDEATYPYVSLHRSPDIKLVSGISHTAMGVTRQKDFTYHGYTVHLGGVGLLGFEKTAQSDWYVNITDPRIWSVREHDMQLRGAPLRSYTQLVPGNTPFAFTDEAIPANAIQITVNSYETELSADKVYSLLLKGQTVSDLLLGIKTETEYSYDPQYKLPEAVTTQHYSGQTLQQTHVVTNEYTHNPEGVDGSYFIGRPYKVSTQTTAYGDVYTTEQTYQYDAKGNVTTLEKKGHNTDIITEIMSYDGYGNITGKTVSVPGMASRIIEYEYDQSGRYVIGQTDVEGLETNYTYNPLYGLVLTETNPYELTTTHTYDGWGKKTGVTDYLGNSIEYSYNRSAGEYTIIQTGDDGSESISVSDILGNVIREGSKDLNDNFSYIAIQYDEFNRKTAESEPFFDTPSHWNTIQYDNYSRPTQTTAHTGKITNITYNGLTTTVNDGVKTVTTTKDAMGNVINHSDPGGSIVYTYYANGNLKQSDYDGVIVSIQQDGWGNKTQLSDPSAGTYTYQYNGFGEITEATTPKGTTTYTYNNQGKLTKKEILGDETDMTTDYSYDPLTKQLTTMQVLSGPEAFTYNYTYDVYKRPVSTTEQTPYTQFERLWQYDSFGRVEKEGYTALHNGSGKTVTQWTAHHYKNGYPWQITDDDTGNLLWQTGTVNARGQLTQGTYGNGIIATHEYDVYGLPLLYSHDKDTGDGMENMLLLEYDFNPQRGTLNSRSSSLFNWQETFSYDNLDRLTGFTDNNGSHEQTYDSRGRITHNQGIGDYAYNTTHPYQAAQVALTPEAHNYYRERGRQSISYNAFKKPVEIRIKERERVSFSYNTFQHRAVMFYGSDAKKPDERPLQKHYAFDGSMEIKADVTSGETTFIFYIGGDAYTAPVVLKSDGETSEFLYLHRDYLGSILAITNQEGEALEKRHFDAWGNIVHLQDGNNTPLPLGEVGSGMLLDRGYTGHEHLQGVELIHMNGRLYDPLLHRFLAPDNYVQDPYNTQNFNRYGYVYNNPLLYVDPSGEFFKEIGKWIKDNAEIITFVATVAVAVVATVATAGMASPLLAGVIVGGTAGFTAGAVGTWTRGGSFGEGLGNGLIQGAIGAVAGGIGAGAGAWASQHLGGVAIQGLHASGAAVKGMLGGAIGGGFGGFAGGTASGLLNGESFGDALALGAKGALFGTAVGGLVGTAQGIRYAKANNLDAWSGKVKIETNTIPEGKLANHLFKGTGKLVDTPANRTLISKISNGKPLGVDQYGKAWYTGVDGAGKSIYTYTQNGVVKGAGYMKMTSVEMILKYGLK